MKTKYSYHRHPASFKGSLSDRTTDELCLVSDAVQRCCSKMLMLLTLFPKIIHHNNKARISLISLKIIYIYSVWSSIWMSHQCWPMTSHLPAMQDLDSLLSPTAESPRLQCNVEEQNLIYEAWTHEHQALGFCCNYELNELTVIISRLHNSNQELLPVQAIQSRT